MSYSSLGPLQFTRYGSFRTLKESEIRGDAADNERCKRPVFFFRQGIISGVEVDLHMYISILFTLFMMILSGRFNIEVR